MIKNVPTRQCNALHVPGDSGPGRIWVTHLLPSIQVSYDYLLEYSDILNNPLYFLSGKYD